MIVSPTPIPISRRTAIALSLAVAALLVLLLWQSRSLLTFLVGGPALAIVLSFPVRLLSRVMPRGLAILVTFLLALAIAAIAVIGVAPVLVDQLGSLVKAIPGIAQSIGSRLPELLEPLAERDLLPVSVDQFVDNLKSELLATIATFGTRVLGGIAPLVTGLIGVAITAFGIVFIAAYLLIDARQLHCYMLQAAPRGYRRDVRDLWDAFVFRLSRYLGGLAISLAVQGVLSGMALYAIGVPYPVLLGAWVSVTALVPYLGAWIGGAPAVLLALSISPTTALVTLLLFVAIQQLEGNFLTPRIQGQAVRVHPILVFLAVIAGGELAGLAGVIFAVPAVAVLRVLYDFFRARLRVSPG